MKTKKEKQLQQTINPRSEGTFFDKLSPSRKNWFCIGILAAIIIILFYNIFFQGMIFAVTGDAAAFNAWKAAMDRIKITEARSDVFWIPHIFSGIPIFSTLLLPIDVNYVEKLLLRLPLEALVSNAGEVRDVIHIFLGGLFMFILGRTLQFPHFVSLLVALIFMLNPYAIGALEAHQGSKLHALSVIPLLFLLTYQLYTGLSENRFKEWKNLLLFGLLALVTGWFMLSLHIQIIFYGLLLVGIFLCYQFLISLRKEPLKAFRIVMTVAVALLIGLTISAYINLPTLEYAQYSIRGGSGGAQGGLDYDYATNWSFHPLEILNYIIPSFFGFSSPFYWGWMPFTESTVYIGIVPVLLGIFALIYKRDRLIWFLVFFSGFILLISFGRHFGILYNLMFDYFPFFNKFRVPVLILHLMPITLSIMAAKGLLVLRDMTVEIKSFNIVKFRKGLYVALALIGGLLVIGLIAQTTLYSSISGFMFQRDDDLAKLQEYGAQAPRALEQLKHMRFDLLWGDYVKFSVIVGISIALILAYLKRKFSFTTLSAGLIVILMIDLIIIDTKFINPKPNSSLKEFFKPDATTQFLLSDTSTYRIYVVGRDFQDNTWMYHDIKSVGGYSPAKLKIYQEMLDSLGIYPPRLPLNLNFLSMLNVKYIISPGQLPDMSMPIVYGDQSKQMVTYKNPDVLDPAFFVDSVLVVKSKKEMFQVLSSRDWNPAKVAVLSEKPEQPVARSESTSVKIIKNWSQDIKLETYCSRQSLLVLSDAYYPAGWKAYIDGSETNIFQTNYVVRSVIVPPGNHTITFSFIPTIIYNTGYTVSHAGYLIVALFLLAGALRSPWWSKKRGGNKDNNNFRN